MFKLNDNETPFEGFCNNIGSSSRPVSIKGTIGSVNTTCLVDTGAAISTLSSEFYQKIAHLTNDVSGQLSIDKVQTANAQPLLIQKLVCVTLCLNDRNYLLTAHVVPGLCFPVILGRDFLQCNRAVIDVGHWTVTFNTNHTVPFLVENWDKSSNATTSLVAYLDTTIVLSPHSESHVQARCSPELACQQNTSFFEPRNCLPDRFGIAGAAALVAIPLDGRFPVRIVNPTDDPVILHQYTKVGSLSPISDDDYVVIEPPTVASIGIPTEDSPAVVDNSPVCILSGEEQDELDQMLSEFNDVFSQHPYDLGKVTSVQHEIDTGDHSPVRSRPYRMPHVKREEADRQIEEMLNAGIINPSSSAWSSPILLVEKADKSQRLVVDFRKTNAISKKDSYPLPLIDETLDQLHGSRYFTTLDLQSGYHQISMHQNSKEKTAFVTHNGLYEFNVMPFGLSNAPSTFQRLMDNTFRDLSSDGLLIYMDDLIIYSATFKEHLDMLRKVCLRLRQVNLKLKRKKCHFGKPSVSFLGHVVDATGVSPNPDKLRVVKDFPQPTTVREVRTFLGLTGYYRRFMADYATIACPLTNLTKKNVSFIWTAACDTAFQMLKTALVSSPVMGYPDLSQEFVLFTDASNDGIGIVLSQIQNGCEVVISYAGRQFTKAERNYSTTEREALAVVEGVKKFQKYLYGRHFTVYTDHAALKWLMSIKEPTGRLARWSLLLQHMDMDICHRPGISHENADALSRRWTTPRTPMLTSAFVAALDVSADPDVPCNIKDLQRSDPRLKDLIVYLEEKTLPMCDKTARLVLLEVDHYYLDESGLLFHLYIPRPNSKQTDITGQLVIPSSFTRKLLKSTHDEPTGGHFGVHKTYAKLRKRYYWHGMFNDIQHWCRSCIDCNRRKFPRYTRRAPLIPLPVEGPFDRVGVDCLGPFKTSVAGNRYIVVFSDYLTKWPEAFAVPAIDASTIARLLVDEIMPRHGSPRALLSDRGANFLSTLVREVCRLLDTKKVNTSSYHPQTDGLVERFNGTIAVALSMYTSKDQLDWDVYLPQVLFAYRVAPSEVTGESPFFLLYGRDPRLPIDVELLPRQDPSPSVLDHRERILRQVTFAQACAQENIQRAQAKMKKHYDKKSKPVPYRVGDQVWIFSPFSKKGLTRKLAYQFHGPYRIIERLSDVHFKVKLPSNRRICSTIHANRMKPFYNPNDRPIGIPEDDDDVEEPYLEGDDLPPDSFQADKAKDAPDGVPPPVQSDIYRAQKITKRRVIRGKPLYRIRWNGFSAKDDTWEPPDNILDKSLLDDFYERHPRLTKL